MLIPSGVPSSSSLSWSPACMMCVCVRVGGCVGTRVCVSDVCACVGARMYVCMYVLCAFWCERACSSSRRAYEDFRVRM